MRRHVNAQPDASARSRVGSAGQPVTHRAVGDGPHWQGATLAGLTVGFKLFPDAGEQSAHLININRIGKRHDAVWTGTSSGAAAAGAALLGRADHHVRYGIIEAEVAPPQRQHLVKATAGVPQRVDQGVLRLVRNVVEQAGYLRRQKVAGELGVGGGHGPQRQRAAIIGLRGRKRDRTVQDR